MQPGNEMFIISKRAKCSVVLRNAASLIVALTVTRAAIAAAVPTVAEVRADFHKLLDRPKVPLAPTAKAETRGQFAWERGAFHSEANQAVPFLLVKPALQQANLPAVIVLHGTGGDKESVAGLSEALADRGMLAVAIDARYHGGRIPGGADRSEQYQDAIIGAWHEKNVAKLQHPFYFDTVYDLWRTVDYLQSRKDVDPQRIGMIGISMGGIETWMAAATDERVRAVVPAIAVQSFRWSLENEQWQGRAATIGRAHQVAASDLGEPAVNSKAVRALWNKVIPGILDEFDCPSMLRVIAPRPMLILSGEKDPNNPLGGAKLAFAAAEEAYKNAQASDRLKIDVAKGIGHAIPQEQMRMALDWLEHWLKQ
jgi:dienelactone hydrolase